MSNFDSNIKTLRDEIDDIDSQLIALLAKRLVVTTKIGELKSIEGIPIIAPKREAAMFINRREKAEKSGVSGDLIEDILRRLMRDSYASQNINGYQCINPNCKKVVIIGGKGKLGGVFFDLFKRSHYQVVTLEQSDWLNSDAILSDASLVIVSVPIRLTSMVIHRLNNLPKDCILADFTSVKESPLYEMMKVHSGPVVGLH
ncbi:MAG: chorismate mutase, partial [Colwellia sp.]